jgi:hypothetical protein
MGYGERGGDSGEEGAAIHVLDGGGGGGNRQAGSVRGFRLGAWEWTGRGGDDRYRAHPLE